MKQWIITIVCCIVGTTIGGVYGQQAGHIERLSAESELHLAQLEALKDNVRHRGFEVKVDEEFACLRPKHERIPYCASVLNPVGEKLTPIEG